MIYQLIYYSRFAGQGGALSTLHDILAVSQRNNARDGITGFLIFDKTNFVQVLEGEEADVRTAYARIAADPRHDNLAVVATRSVTQRDFPEWSMGGFVRSPEARDIYARHGVDGTMDATALRAVQVVALARDLAALEETRRGGRIIDVAAPRA